MNHSFKAVSEEDLIPVAEKLIQFSYEYPIILLKGEMGTGKTTLVRTMMKQCGVLESSSPTFSLVNQYDTEQGKFYHFDLYRIEDSEELLDFGFEEYLNSGDPCLLEWPDIAMGLIPEPYIEVKLTLEADRSRSINLVLPSPN